MAKQKRDSDYYVRRLEMEHPAIFADWKAGKYPSARKALEAAGLRKPSRTVNALKNAWSKATTSERSDFLAWIGAPTSSSTSSSVVDANRRLIPATAARIRRIMDLRAIKMGDVMAELGLSRRNASLGNAMQKVKPSRLRPEVIKKLEIWLETNKRF